MTALGWILWPAFLAALGAWATLAGVILMRRARRAPQHAGATERWSPADEFAQTPELTPTEMLAGQPVALDDGRVVGTSPLPSWERLSTDTHHVVDDAWQRMLADFNQRTEAALAEFLRPRTVVWWSEMDKTEQWNASDLRAALQLEEASR